MKLTENDISKVLRNLPGDVMEFIQENPVYLAGGFIRAVLNNDESQDIDLFTGSRIRVGQFAINMGNASGHDVTGTENACTVHRDDLPSSLSTAGRSTTHTP